MPKNAKNSTYLKSNELTFMSVAWVLLILKCIMNSEFKILKTNKMMTNSLSYRHISRKIILEKKLLMLDEICRTYTRVSGLGAEDATPLDLQLMLQPTNVIIYGTKAKAEMAFFHHINSLVLERSIIYWNIEIIGKMSSFYF